MKSESNFAELWGIAIGDGWIGRGSGLTLFISGDPIEDKNYYDKHIKLLFKNVFNYTINPIPFAYWDTYGIAIGKKEIIKEFIKNNFPIGKKKLIKIPIKFKSKRRLSISLLRGIFDTDGTIYFQKNYNKETVCKWKKEHHYIPVVGISSINKNFISDLKLLIEKYTKIRCHLEYSRPSKTAPNPTWKVVMKCKNNVENWFDIINPQNFKHISKFLVWKKLGYYTPRMKLIERLKTLNNT